MATLKVADIIAALSELPLAELLQLEKAVTLAVRNAASATVVDTADRPPCPFCTTGNPKQWGRSGTDRRWRCRACGKTWTPVSGTPLAYAKKRPELIEAARDMVAVTPLSCRELGEHLDVHHMTAWRWRLKILRSVADFGEAGLSGLVEADETFFRESRKGSREWVRHAGGMEPSPPRPRWRDHERLKLPLPRGLSRWQIPVLVLRDRQGKTVARRLASLKFASFVPVLDGSLATDALLCTDAAAVYRRWAKTRNRVIEQINARKGVRVRGGVFHIQNANAYHSRFKDFMKPFRGPSARHLKLYVGWMAFRDAMKGKDVGRNPLISRLLGMKRCRDETRVARPKVRSPLDRG